MSRPGYRARLENGLKLDLNRLAEQGFVQRGTRSGPIGIRWTSNYWGEIASGTITADMSGLDGPDGWFRIQIGSLDQRIHLVARRRHFGGRQWYFLCPYLNRQSSVLWMPPGAHSFACRQKWGRQVAYASQFLDRDSRVHQAKSKINAQLCGAVMTSEAQLVANRQNALKSTGPRTPEGKAVVALNGTKHGLLSREVLVKGEREADLMAFGDGLRAQLAPDGALEDLLVDRIITTAWRLRRSGELEARLLSDKHSDGTVFENVLPWDSDRKKLQLLSRYEAALERAFYKALHELQRLQAARDGQIVPVPEMVDVTVSSDEEMALVRENETIVRP